VPFKSVVDRDEHHQRHAKEFPAGLTPAEYEQRAEAFMNGPAKWHQILRPHIWGGQHRLDFITEEYCRIDQNGFIITYFVADPAVHKKSSNLKYFEEYC
jgi:hypothetical protein